MLELQADSNLGFIGLVELAGALNGRSRYIQLPSFQRDAVWDEAHIELLWDSIWRGYPVGSLLFADVAGLGANEQLAVRGPQVSRFQAAGEVSDDVAETRYIIIDGQQRAIAIALGFRQFEPTDSARLWVDLGAGAEKMFAVCSIQKPWGREATSSQIAHAQSYLDKHLLTPRGDLPQDIPPLLHTWPTRCILPIPLAELLHWLENGRKEEWHSLVPEAKRQQPARADLETVFQRLQEMRQMRLPVYLVRELSTAQLGEVFHRLNKQGVAMSDQELFFSALKMKWPKAHNLVWAIYADEETGYVMNASEIVHLAVRLALGSEQYVPKLNLAEFERMTNEKPTQFTALQALLEKEPGGENGRLHTLLRQVRTLLAYDPQLGDDDPGLPAILLARLPPRVWHTLVAWLAQHHQVADIDRQEMIRYALLDYYFSGNSTQRLERIPFDLAWQSEGGFPGFAIYAALWRAGQLESNIPTVEVFASRLHGADGSPPPGAIFKKESQLGLWTQRTWLQKWFPNFDPTRYGSSKELPYDLDHILPTDYSNLRRHPKHVPPALEFWQWRWRIILGPGNVRFWPASLNRSDQHKNLAKKYLLGPSDLSIPDNSLLRAYDLETVSQVRAASLLDDDQLNNWERGANDPTPYNWHDPERIRALRRATDSRRLALYRQFYDGQGYGTWQEQFAPWLAATIRREVVESWIQPARQTRPGEVTFTARSVAEQLKLPEQIEAICQALDAPQFYLENGLYLKQRSDPIVGDEAQWVVEWKA